MTEQYGAPLTGAQMKLLRAAGLPGGTKVMFLGATFRAGDCSFNHIEPYRLPADHAAYTLLEAGWLDGRNVVLWFGGDKAPDDWLEGSDVLFRGGVVPPPLKSWTWGHLGIDGDILAYTRKAEGLTTHADRVLADAERAAKRMGGKFVKNELWNDLEAVSNGNGWDAEAAMRYAASPQTETVTIAKMTEAEWAQKYDLDDEDDIKAMKVIRDIGLIREPTRLERFWSTRDTKDVYGPPCRAFQLIEEALEFE